MKKFPIKLCVLTVAAAMSVQLGLPAAAESTVGEISFDYNTEDDNAPVFERVNGNIVCERSERDSTVGDYCLLISSESAGTKNIAASNMNLDTYTKNAYKAEMSFDMRVPYKSRTNIGIYDADVKGEYPGESSGAKYSSAGNFFTISGSDGKLSVNGTDIAAKITNDSGEFDWVHYELSFDFEDKKMSYAALSADESVEYCSESNVDFADAQLSRISGIDTYSWLAGTQAELDNLKLTAYEQDSQTDEGITYSGKTVKMNVSGAESGVLIRAAYENDKIDKAEIYNITFENGTAETELELEYGDTLYLWDSLQGMRPLAKKYTYAADEPISTPTIAPTEAPAEERDILYSQDFEQYDDGENAGWTTSQGNVAVMSESSDGIGKYIAADSQAGTTNKARSSWFVLPDKINENFVLEADFKSSEYPSNVSAFEILENKASLYVNHGCYSNGNYVFKMDRPMGENRFVINNEVSDSALELSDYAAPVVITSETGDEWLHIRTVGNFDTKTVIAYITSKDGANEYYHGMTDMSGEIDGFELLTLLSPNSGTYSCLDNIVIYRTRAVDLAPVYHTVSISCGNTKTEEYVCDGENVVNIPDVSSYGTYFEGWRVNSGEAVYSSEELAALPITEDSEIVGVISDDYIEPMAAVEFGVFPASGELTMGEDEDTYGDNIISVSVTGEQGTSLVTNPDERVTDYCIDWTFDGFRILDGTPTHEEGSSYCDSYAEIEKKNQSTVNFKLKRTAANYYGLVRVKVTYNGKTLETQRPLLLLGDRERAVGAILPKEGYCADYGKYDSALGGYELSEDDDILTGGWSHEGSQSKKMSIQSEEGTGYIRFSRDSSGSAYGYNEIGDIKSQTLFEQDIRFNIDGSVSYTGGKSTKPDSTAFTLSLTDGKFVFNGNEIGTGENEKWYHAVIMAEPVSKQAWAKVYELDENGSYTQPLCESGIVGFADDDYSGGNYYRITPANAAGSVDFNNVNVKREETDDDTVVFELPESITIPQNGETTAQLKVSAKTTSGNDVMGAADWKITDSFAEGATITNGESGTAEITITSDASGGMLPLSAEILGKAYTCSVKLTGGKSSIVFEEEKGSVLIPEEGESTAHFLAYVVDGDGNKTEDAVEYVLLDADGNAYTNDEITIDSSSGEMKVSSEAMPASVVVCAVSGEISKKMTVSVYNLKFDFGEGRDGFTNVSVSDSYSELRDYGMEGNVSADGTHIEGDGFAFKVNLERGNVYNVKLTYKGTIYCERADEMTAGIEMSNSELTETEYDIAVFGDDVMDITFDGEGELESVIITHLSREAAKLPEWWTIGDSTVAQSGSWANTLALTESGDKVTSDFSNYPSLEGVISKFHNSGSPGRKHASFYSQGMLNDILTNMHPGDVVSISGMGTNDSTSTLEQFMEYNIIYITAIADMGGKVILGSYTPTGNYGKTEGAVYDSDTMTFKGMRTDDYDKAIRRVYEQNKDKDYILGFIDIGADADSMMTADVQNVYNSAVAAGDSEQTARQKANARAEEMMAWWKDYNHYYKDFSEYILPSITEQAAECIKNGE